MGLEVRVRPMLLPELRNAQASGVMKRDLVEVDVWEQRILYFNPLTMTYPEPIHFFEIKQRFVVPKDDWRRFALDLCEHSNAPLVVEEEP